MPKLKDILPNIFSNNNTKKKNNNNEVKQKIDDKTKDDAEPKPVAGILETDALPVDEQDDQENYNNQSLGHPNESNASLSASTELSESAARELSNPNYDSTVGTVVTPSTMDVAIPNTALQSSTNNTMNVHNQQQLVLQISNASNLHFGPVYNVGDKALKTNGEDVGKRQQQQALQQQQQQMPRRTTSIVAMMQSKDEPTHRILDAVSTHLGEGWKDIMRKLGNSDGQIDQAVIDHQMHGGIKEVIYQLLLQWKRNADDDEATLGYLTTLLWQSNQRDCVQRMKLVWKSDAKRKTSAT